MRGWCARAVAHRDWSSVREVHAVRVTRGVRAGPCAAWLQRTVHGSACPLVGASCVPSADPCET